MGSILKEANLGRVAAGTVAQAGGHRLATSQEFRQEQTISILDFVSLSNVSCLVGFCLDIHLAVEH